MKTKYLIIALFICFASKAQFSKYAQYDEYFSGNKFVCENSDPEVKKLMKLGIDCFQYPEYYATATNVFMKVIKQDSTNCDAYFFAGYSLRLQNNLKEATAFYYMADSLSGNKSFVFKQNLAFTAMAVGATKIARKKYTEMTTYFPESPEGYYGIALTSLEVKDFDNGLKNATIAISKYQQEDEGAFYIKGMLLVIKEQYAEALPCLEKIKSKFKKNDNFNAAYSICLYKTGTENNDEKKIKNARKALSKIRLRANIIPEFLPQLTF